MKRIFLLCLLASCLTMCKTANIEKTLPVNSNTNEKTIENNDDLYYVEQIKNDFRSVSEEVKTEFLKGYKATDKQYSILFFTQGFNDDEIIVKNNENTIFKGKISTNGKTGLAKNMRIINTENNAVYDRSTKKTIFIDTKMASKYKFIYVMKDLTNKEKPYKITYSDLLRPN